MTINFYVFISKKKITKIITYVSRYYNICHYNPEKMMNLRVLAKHMQFVSNYNSNYIYKICKGN